MGLLWYSLCVLSVDSSKNLVLQIWGIKGSKRGQNGAFPDFLEKSSLVFLDIVHVNRGQ